jgi:hypothetical protein
MRASPDSPAWVRRTLGGNGLAGGGHTVSPSSATVYGVAASGGRSWQWTIA